MRPSEERSDDLILHSVVTYNFGSSLRLTHCRFRPTAEDLLNGDDIPQGPQSKNSMKALVETVGGHGSGSYGFLMTELFNRGNPGWVERRWGERGGNKEGIKGLRKRLKGLGVDRGGLPFLGVIGSNLIGNLSSCLDLYKPQPTLRAPQSMRVAQAGASVGLSLCEGITGAVGNALSTVPKAEQAENDPRLVTWTKGRIAEVMQKAGAAEIRTPIFSPSVAWKEGSSKSPHEVLDREGTVVQARGDLLKGFARYVARAGGVGAIRRYDINDVYSKGGKGGGPVERMSAEYSVIIDRDSKAEHVAKGEAVAEVECMLVTEDVMRAVGEGWMGGWRVRVGNARVDELIMDLMGFEAAEVRKNVLEIMVQLTRMTKKKGNGVWEEKNRMLEGIRGFVGEEVLGRLRLFLSPQLMPLDPDPLVAIDSIMQSALKVSETMDLNANNAAARRSQRIINSLSELVLGTKQSLGLYVECRDTEGGGSVGYGIGVGEGGRGLGFEGVCWSAWVGDIKVAEGGR